MGPCSTREDLQNNKKPGEEPMKVPVERIQVEEQKPYYFPNQPS